MDALDDKRFFKLIAGGSLTELDSLAFLTRLYTQAGADCLDIAPVPEVVETVFQTLQGMDRPKLLVMVSVPLDPDPHFRKIELVQDACITCGLCVPLCPTETFTLQEILLVEEPLCYGCGRCIPVCPTEALVLHPFLVAETLISVLSHPIVEAIELHTQHADPVMLSQFLKDYGHLLQNKLIAYCFRPDEAKSTFWLESIRMLQAFAPGRILLQIDGAPMSGNENVEASLPALKAAATVRQILDAKTSANIPLTISGGINQHTVSYLHDEMYQFIAGVGMGTVARKAVWQHKHDQQTALSIAQQLISPLQKRAERSKR